MGDFWRGIFIGLLKSTLSTVDGVIADRYRQNFVTGVVTDLGEFVYRGRRYRPSLEIFFQGLFSGDLEL